MYPTANLAGAMRRDSTLLRGIWEMLNQITPDKLIDEGRVYGGGLRKLEPNELANVDVTAIAELIPGFKGLTAVKQLCLLGDDNELPANNTVQQTRKPRATEDEHWVEWSVRMADAHH